MVYSFFFLLSGFPFTLYVGFQEYSLLRLFKQGSTWAYSHGLELIVSSIIITRFRLDKHEHQIKYCTFSIYYAALMDAVGCNVLLIMLSFKIAHQLRIGHIISHPSCSSKP